MKTIGIYTVGYVPLDAEKACRLLNSCQTAFSFKAGSGIFRLGEPDLSGYGYSDQAFFDLLAPHVSESDYLVAITSVPLQGNYFTRTLGCQFIITTLFECDELLDRSGRSAEDNLALTMCQELVSFEFQRVTGKGWRELFHGDPRGCIFDFAGLKEQKVAKLRCFDICQPCRGVLAAANLNHDTVESVNRILGRIRRPSAYKALVQSVSSPHLAFIYGGIVCGALVNAVSGVLMSATDMTRSQIGVLAALLTGIPLFPAGVYAWEWLMYLRSRLR